MMITMIGHSTVLLEIGGMRILTDPYFGTWGNPAYMRPAPPSRSREEIEGIDLVLISHNHFDHVDRRFLSSLGPNVPVVAPARVRWLTRLHGAKSLRGVRAWEKIRYSAVEITAVPALHLTVTLGFVITGEGRHVYFAGDTFHRPFMAEIGERFDLDVALMPVTTFRIPMTMGEKSAVRAARDLKPSVTIPIHLGLQPRSPLMRTKHTPEGFRQRIRDAGLETTVVILREGESWQAYDDR